jgi:hypothetical protein
MFPQTNKALGSPEPRMGLWVCKTGLIGHAQQLSP